MISKLIISTLFSLCLVMPTFAQPPEPALGASNKVEGLELPPDQTVNFDEGFVNVAAKSEGPVKWLVIGNSKVKYVTFDATKSIIISIPPQGGQITVFAISIINNKFTDFARHNITINGNSPTPGPGPEPNPTPTPSPTGGPFHITFVVDLNNTTPEIAKLLNSETFRIWVQGTGHFFRVYDFNNPIVKQKKLDTVVSKVGSAAVCVIQNNTGSVVQAFAMPKTEAEVKSAITQILGGK